MERTESTTPLANVHRNLAQLPDGDSRQKVILICTGSYNPVHRMHIEMFAHAKRELEESHGCVVLAAFISPSGDSWVSDKAKGEESRTGHYFYLKATDRAKIVERSISDAGFSDWLAVDTWELSQRGFTDFDDVTEDLKKYVTREFPGETPDTSSIRVLYICGGDHLLKCRGTLRSMITSGGMGVCAIARAGYDISRAKLPAEGYFVVGALGDVDFSSTKVRRLYFAEDWDGLAELMFPGAVELMRSMNTRFRFF